MKTKKLSAITMVRILFLALVLFVSGCSPIAEEASKTAEEILLDPTLSFIVKVRRDEAAYMTTHKLIGGIEGDTDWSQPCAVKSTDFVTSNYAITCIAEGHELDIWALDSKIEVSVPANVCDYVVERPYYYFKFIPGRGTPTPPYTEEDPICPYNYTLIDGPNCCTGKWTMNDGGTPAKVRTGSYGGDFANCYGSPTGNMTDKNGIPKGILTYTNNASLKKTIILAAPEKQSSGSNVLVANYWRPSEHSHVSTSPLLGGLTAPIAFDPQTDPVNGITYGTNPYYTFQCLDRNHEVKAQIRLLIREWNVGSELKLGGNPDSTGNSPIGDPLADIFDWRDFGDAGPSIFPGQ